MESYRSYESSRESQAREAYLHLHRIDMLMAELVESGPELDPIAKRDLRRYLSQFFGFLGIERAEDLLDVQQRLNIEHEYEFVPKPPAFPTKEEFKESLIGIIRKSNKVPRSRVTENPSASDLARNGTYNWGEIVNQGGGDTLNYLYDLGKIMTHPGLYDVMFPDSDPVTVGRDWRIRSGKHRALALRTLGPEFVSRSGMDRWVTVGKAK